ncbi:hypothetical protein JQC92_13195 [Shewanella sp. 202IG2-18]|uniref:hypothetical protein n=1 Tax=Parashewanella hymeniacidonis TaxID=2807618 RepID=UPI00196100BB|nr:hypothetical protein [Parashewanella hymeniacidonis]MBM7072971.1 hypothetical protein [Parashewanella hymeniacidonis]
MGFSFSISQRTVKNYYDQAYSHEQNTISDDVVHTDKSLARADNILLRFIVHH